MFAVKCSKLFHKVFLSIQFLFTYIPIHNPASKHTIVRKPVFSTSHVNTSPAPTVVTLNSSLPLHVCDVPVPTNLLCNVRKVSPPIALSADLTTTSRSHALTKKFPHAPRKSVFYDDNYE